MSLLNHANVDAAESSSGKKKLGETPALSNVCVESPAALAVVNLLLTRTVGSVNQLLGEFVGR